MTSVSDVLKAHSNAGPMHSMIPAQAALGNHTFMTKSGDLFQVLTVEGIDYECLDASDVAQISQRYDAATRGLGEEFRIYQYFVKREHPPLSPSTHTNPVVQAAADDRRVHLNHKTLYSLQLYMVISYEGWRKSFGAPQARKRPRPVRGWNCLPSQTTSPPIKVRAGHARSVRPS